MVAAAGKLDCPVVLAVGADADIPSPVPANVQVFRELPYEQYLERLRNARAVAVPLVPIGRSTGQIALLEAMAYGKAVAASAVAGVADYVRHGTNALLVPPRDPEAMAEALARLVSDGGLRARLARTALSDAETRYAMEPYARRLLSALESFAKARI